MMKKKAVWATVLILTVVSAFALVAYADPAQMLRPVGRIRVSLEDNSYSGTIPAGRATWNPFIQVWDGSFSAELNFGPHDDDFGAVVISPLNIPLSTLKTLGTGGITFWAYFYDLKKMTPIVDMVLDNGRVMEGVSSVPVTGTVDCESGTGCKQYPTSDLWIQMKPYNGWTSSYSGVAGSGIPAGWGLTNAKTLLDWYTLFPTARVVQLRISYGFCGKFGGAGLYGNQCNPGDTGQVFIDNVIFVGRPIPLEPESVGLPPHQV